MFEDIAEIPELKGFNALDLYLRMKGRCGHALLEDNIHDGAVDAYMEALSSGDWAEVIHNAYRYSYRRYSREVYRLKHERPIITFDEWAAGYRGIVAEESCIVPTPDRPRYDERGLTVSLRCMVDEEGEAVLENLKKYLQTAVERLGITYPDHSDYNFEDLFYAYYMDGSKVTELFARCPSFKNYGTFARRFRIDVERLRNWVQTQEGVDAFEDVLGVSPSSLGF